MRVVHINYDDHPQGGASIAMLRLHFSLKQCGVDSLIVCPCVPFYDDSHQWPHGFSKMFVWCLIITQSILLKLFWGQAYSINIVSRGLANYINSLKPDIVHLHWLQANTMSLSEIKKIKAPLVWSLHDCWPMLGLDAIPVNKWYKTGFPKTSGWLDRWVWQRKCNLIRAKSISAVVASQWMVEDVKSSLAFENQDVFHVPLALDDKIFELNEKIPLVTSRNKVFTVLFGSTSDITNFNKGFDRLVGSLEKLDKKVKKNTQIIVFGSRGNISSVADIPIFFTGKIDTEAVFALYRRADVLAFPSRFETCGQVKLEALGSGLPVVAFQESACAEGIIHQHTGWIARPNDLEDFGRGILWAYELWSDIYKRTKMSVMAQKYIRNKHSPISVAQILTEKYMQVLKNYEKINENA